VTLGVYLLAVEKLTAKVDDPARESFLPWFLKVLLFILLLLLLCLFWFTIDFLVSGSNSLFSINGDAIGCVDDSMDWDVSFVSENATVYLWLLLIVCLPPNLMDFLAEA